MFPVDSSEVPAQTSEAVQKGSAKQILVRPEPGPAQTQTHREHGQDPAMPHHKRTIVAPCLVVIHFLFLISICDGVMTCAFPTCNVWFNYRSEKHQRLMSGREQLQALGFPAISSFGGAPWLRSRPSMTNHIKDQRFYHCVEHQKNQMPFWNKIIYPRLRIAWIWMITLKHLFERWQETEWTFPVLGLWCWWGS